MRRRKGGGRTPRLAGAWKAEDSGCVPGSVPGWEGGLFVLLLGGCKREHYCSSRTPGARHDSNTCARSGHTLVSVAEGATRSRRPVFLPPAGPAHKKLPALCVLGRDGGLGRRPCSDHRGRGGRGRRRAARGEARSTRVLPVRGLRGGWRGCPSLFLPSGTDSLSWLREAGEVSSFWSAMQLLIRTLDDRTSCLDVSRLAIASAPGIFPALTFRSSRDHGLGRWRPARVWWTCGSSFRSGRACHAIRCD